jgi:hypothetical protein
VHRKFDQVIHSEKILFKKSDPYTVKAKYRLKLEYVKKDLILRRLMTFVVLRRGVSCENFLTLTVNGDRT